MLYTGKLDTKRNLSLCSVKRNVKSYTYIARTKIDKSVDFVLIIFHFTNVFVIYLYPCTEIDIKSFKSVSWLKTFFIKMCYKPIIYENETIFEPNYVILH